MPRVFMWYTDALEFDDGHTGTQLAMNLPQLFLDWSEGGRGMGICCS